MIQKGIERFAIFWVAWEQTLISPTFHFTIKINVH